MLTRHYGRIVGQLGVGGNTQIVRARHTVNHILLAGLLLEAAARQVGIALIEARADANGLHRTFIGTIARFHHTALHKFRCGLKSKRVANRLFGGLKKRGLLALFIEHFA